MAYAGPLVKGRAGVNTVSDHVKGLLITALGVGILSPDALLVRLVDAGPWPIVVWRGVLTFLALAAALAVIRRGRLWTAFRAVGRWGLVSSLFFATNTTVFVYSITHTAAANTLVIIAGGPLFGAVLSRIFLRERVAPETWAATVLVVAGIAVLVWDGLHQGTWTGDLAAIVAALSLSANFVVMRHRKDINMVPATALGGLWSALAVAAVGGALIGLDAVTVAPGDFVWVAAMGLVVVPGAFGLITIGPRYITAPEVGLLMLLETLLGPLWVWLLLNDLPTPTALAAGVFVVVTLIVYFTVRLRRQAAPRGAPASGMRHRA